ncbi:MAG: tetratricopeptide repeat protein, partial [Deltaproteobacteria bacterium]|nr:tetratricopeptide repeat protein [Deltaproteobacteria bacterium]
LDPSDAEAYYELGLVYLAAGQKQKAIGIYSKLKVLDPGAAEIVKRLAEK